jgi:hypothetical protein
MKTLALGVLILTAVVAGCAKPPEPAPAETEQLPADAKAKPPEPAQEVPEALAAIFKERNKLHKRQTGALLTISPKWEVTPPYGPLYGPLLRVAWAIEYNGPRRPFTILTPGDNSSAAVRTKLHVWYLRPDGKPTTFEYPFDGIGELPLPKKKDWFSVAADGKPVTGKLPIMNQDSLNAEFGRELRLGQPRAWVQLEHAPTDRGDPYAAQLGFEEEQWTMDAWTGQLWSPVVEVAVK